MSQLIIRELGTRPYLDVWQDMKDFTDARSAETADELWFVEHPQVFTLGQAGKEIHILEDIGVPVVKTDRGGQVTYHGPGQLVGYTLFNLKRKKLGVRDLVTGIEQSIIDVLSKFNIESAAKRVAPGVYVNEQKIAALGLRLRRGCSYHGFSINVDMDLSPFAAINPCGYQGLEVTHLKQLGVNITSEKLAPKVVDEITARCGYDGASWPDSSMNKRG
jgi:lipoyl(octanoyl) transferase